MKLDTIIPWGRSRIEYMLMFSLSTEDLKKSILGCGDGPASFNARLTACGGNVTSVDPIYQFSTKEIKDRINKVYNDVIEQVEAHKEDYVWEHIPNVKTLGKLRMEAMTDFLNDYDKGRKEGRYLNESLPSLSFEDNQFDLALCSHYLFLYSDQISEAEHIKSTIELARVAKEVRIYPLTSLDGHISKHLNRTRSMLEAVGIESELRMVPYLFQKGADQMLVLSRKR